MRKIREVLRLRFELGLLQDQIARSCAIGQSTVHRYLERATAAGLSWPLPEDCDDQRLNELLFPSRPLQVPHQLRASVDFSAIHGQLTSHKHVTLQLLWEEYRQTQPDGYGYSRFCELYQRWHCNRSVVMRQEHRPGEKTFVDWAGPAILAALRHHRFFSLTELNEAIGQLLEKLNHRPFRKREGTRASLFAEVDRPVLQPLPAERYVMASWKTVRANIDYHVEIDRHYYSVPYQLASQQMEARSTAHTVEIFHLGKRVASHQRSSAPYQHTVIREHMPKSHQAHLEWTPSRLIHWAETVAGEATAGVVRSILESRPHPEMGYRACLGIMSLARTYTNERLEAASQRALQLQACSYQPRNSSWTTNGHLK